MSNTENEQTPYSYDHPRSKSFKLVNVSSLSVSGGVLRSSGPDVHNDSTVLSVRGAGGCVCVPGTL